EAQLHAYDKFWMAVTDEAGFLEARYHRGMTEGLEKGRAEGMEKGRAEERNVIVSKMKQLGIPAEQIAKSTGIPVEEIKM
ncbi:MAG: hypothetical protein J6Y34_01020, partial [Bacteroidales bacterium]|nr:hypothetical protein [Bacteroidales bacterium]